MTDLRDKITHFIYPSLKTKDIFIKRVAHEYISYGDLVLDVGCSERNIEHLAKLRHSQYFGVEYPVWQNMYSVISIPKRPDAWIDIMQSGFKSSSFHTIFMFDVVEHLSDPEIAFKNRFQMLSVRGKLVILIPFLIELHGGQDAEEDYIRMSPNGLKAFLTRAGFSVVNTQVLGTFGDTLVSLTSGFYLRHFFASGTIQKILFFLLGGCSILIINIIKPLLNLIDRLNRNPTYIAAIAIK